MYKCACMYAYPCAGNIFAGVCLFVCVCVFVFVCMHACVRACVHVLQRCGTSTNNINGSKIKHVQDKEWTFIYPYNRIISMGIFVT